MLLRVDFSVEMFRWLFQSLYKRVDEFGEGVSVRDRFISLLAGDERIQLLVDLQGTDIQSHCLFTIQPWLNDKEDKQAFVEQISTNSGHDEEFVKACISYIESIPNVKYITMVTEEKKYRAFRKKYEFEVFKVLMRREVKE